jgi:hypothetical protein
LYCNRKELTYFSSLKCDAFDREQPKKPATLSRRIYKAQINKATLNKSLLYLISPVEKVLIEELTVARDYYIIPAIQVSLSSSPFVIFGTDCILKSPGI